MHASVERWLGTLFGLIFIALSIVVTAETVSRKLFNVSLQGADELGGYALAFGATIAFSLALMGRTHIRVDAFHYQLPHVLQTALNWLSALGLAAFAGLMAWLAWFAMQDSRAYQSVAQTPWATPLVIPQTAWLAGLIIFAAIAFAQSMRASWLLLKGCTVELNADFGPRSAKQEVDEELHDIRARNVAAPVESRP